MSRFNLMVQFVPVKDNVAAEFMSRWAYTASMAFVDATLHGIARDEEEMAAIMQEERRLLRASGQNAPLECWE